MLLMGSFTNCKCLEGMYYLCITLLTIKYLNIEFFSMSTDPLLDGNSMKICVKSMVNLVNFMDVYF